MGLEILIPPMPMEYTTYSEGEAIAKTEEFYEKIFDNYKQVEVYREDYSNKLNHLLQSEASVAELEKVFEDKGAQLLSGALNEFHVLRVLCRIARDEVAFSEPCLLQNIHSMKEAVDWLQLCVFALRDFEFDREVRGELLLQVREKKLSYICLAEIVAGSWIVQKIHAAERIAGYLYENGHRREALLLLMRLEQKLPYSEQKIIAFAMVLLDMGEHRLAYEVLMKYQNPNGEICQLQAELRALLQEK